MRKKLLLLSLMAGPLLVYSADQGKKPASHIQEEIRIVSDEAQAPKLDAEEEKVDVPFIKVQKKAEFPGGMKNLSNYLEENLRYPQQALNDSIEGRIIVKFTVRKDGSISDIKVIRPVHPLLDEEAIRVVKEMPKWIPAQSNGKDVSSYFTLPVRFTISPEVGNDKK